MTDRQATPPIPDEPVAARPTAPLAELPPAAVLAIAWLLPGAGFVLYRMWARGAAVAAMVLLTFVLGLNLHGGVMWPTWNPRAQDFNLINNLTVVVQAGMGVPAAASLLAYLAAPELAERGAPEDGRGGWVWLGGRPRHPYYELGSYFLIVAGAINYFAVFNLYDRVVRRDPRYREDESGAQGAAGGADSAEAARS